MFSVLWFPCLCVYNGLLLVILVVWVSLLSFPSPICWAVFLNISWHVLLSYLPLKMSCFHSFFWYKCWYSQSHFLNSAPVSVFSYRLQFFIFSQAITEMGAFICTCTRWPKFNIKYMLLRKHELRLFFFKISLLLVRCLTLEHALLSVRLLKFMTVESVVHACCCKPRLCVEWVCREISFLHLFLLVSLH